MTHFGASEAKLGAELTRRSVRQALRASLTGWKSLSLQHHPSSQERSFIPPLAGRKIVLTALHTRARSSKAEEENDDDDDDDVDDPPLRFLLCSLSLFVWKSHRGPTREAIFSPSSFLKEEEEIPSLNNRRGAPRETINARQPAFSTSLGVLLAAWN